MNHTIHIIGAGMAGLAAAVKLAAADYRPQLYESAPHAGGRCRSYHDPQLGITLDNGNHLILGSNRAALGYIRQIGSENYFCSADRSVYPFIDAATGERWHCPFPGRIPGVPLREYLHFLRLLYLKEESTVAECFPENSPLFERLIDPLVTAALNTRPSQAQATLFRRMLLHALRYGREGGRYHLSIVPLSQSLVDPAIAYLQQRGGDIHYQCALKGVTRENGRITALQFHARNERMLASGETVICALPGPALSHLLPEIATPQHFSSILNVHFAWDAPWPVGINSPSLLGVIHSPVHWIFFKPGVISTTTSAADTADIPAGSTQEEIAQLVWQEIKTPLQLTAPLPPFRVLLEKRATSLHSPDNRHHHYGCRTPYSNLFLAGDWVDRHLPCTIDSAVSSGFLAAKEALQSQARKGKD